MKGEKALFCNHHLEVWNLATMKMKVMSDSLRPHGL